MRMSQRTRRLDYGLLGLSLSAWAVFQVVRHETGLWQVIAFAVVPDLPMLIGAGSVREKGRISPRAVRPYNATHRLVGPIVLAAVAWLLGGAAWFTGGLAWGAHIAFDRSLGFGLRGPDGSIRTAPAPRRPVLLGLAALVAGAVAAGAAYEWLAGMNDGTRYPAPGRLVAVGGHRVHLHCVGSGSPTVVMEAGLGEQSLTWSLVQPEVAGATRACSYDRGGYGWSEPGPEPRSPGREAVELHDLLSAAAEDGPYVLVAHSLGANVTRLYVDRYREEVAGVVLVEPTDEGSVVRVGTPRFPIAQYRLFSLLERLGLVRLFGSSLVPAMVGTDPPDPVMERLPLVYDATSLETSAAELRASVDGARAVAAVTTPSVWGDLPLVVITAAEGGDASFGERLADLSTAGIHMTAEGSGHYVQYERPDLVIGTILDVIDEARNRSPLRRLV